MPVIKVRRDTVPVELTTPEVKLIQRMRQLRKNSINQVVIVMTQPLSLIAGNRIEKLEKIETPDAQSGDAGK
jgi:hypothetical protein